MLCPLCQNSHVQIIRHQQFDSRQFWHCQNCDMIFVDQKDHPTPEQEKQRYSTHQNNFADQGYIDFLQKLTNPLLKVLKEKKVSLDEAFQVLDYGCGPGPILPQVLQQQSFQVQLYDLYFYPQTSLLQKKWDLIISTEVFEHFRQPGFETNKIISLLKKNGFLAVMTSFHQGPEHFKNWWYARDLTHLCFYSEKTLSWLSLRWGLRILLQENPVVIFQKV